MPEYHLWNSGWAKLAELINAYRFRDVVGGTYSHVPIPSNGSLEVVNSRTALVVQKHWLLLLGLLGRYGERADKGVLRPMGIRRDLAGERAGIALSRSAAQIARVDASLILDSDGDLMPVSSPESAVASVKSHNGRLGYQQSWDSDFDTSHGLIYDEAQRNPWGSWTLGT